MSCEICQKFLKQIAVAELQKDYQRSRVFRSLLEGHRDTTCNDYVLVRQLWPGKRVITEDTRVDPRD